MGKSHKPRTEYVICLMAPNSQSGQQIAKEICRIWAYSTKQALSAYFKLKDRAGLGNSEATRRLVQAIPRTDIPVNSSPLPPATIVQARLF